MKSAIVSALVIIHPAFSEVLPENQLFLKISESFDWMTGPFYLECMHFHAYLLHTYDITTVKPPNNGHIGTTNFVRYTEMSVARRVQRSRAYLMS